MNRSCCLTIRNCPTIRSSCLTIRSSHSSSPSCRCLHRPCCRDRCGRCPANWHCLTIRSGLLPMRRNRRPERTIHSGRSASRMHRASYSRPVIRSASHRVRPASLRGCHRSRSHRLAATHRVQIATTSRTSPMTRSAHSPIHCRTSRSNRPASPDCCPDPPWSFPPSCDKDDSGDHARRRNVVAPSPLGSHGSARQMPPAAFHAR